MPPNAMRRTGVLWLTCPTAAGVKAAAAAFFRNVLRFKAPAPELSLRRTVYNARGSRAVLDGLSWTDDHLMSSVIFSEGDKKRWPASHKTPTLYETREYRLDCAGGRHRECCGAADLVCRDPGIAWPRSRRRHRNGRRR